MPKRIHVSVFNNSVKPIPFYSQKTRAVFIGFGMPEINLIMRGIIIPGNNYGLSRFFIRICMCKKCFIKIQFILKALIAHLRDKGIHAVFHYLPLHLSIMGQKHGGSKGDCPVAERISDQLVRLPFFADLSPHDQDRVIEGVRTFAL